jgi:rhodanese-related sulfurtransferase
MKPRRISINDLERRLDAGDQIVLIDSRSATAWDASAITAPGAIRVPPDRAERHLDQLPRGRAIVTYCT